MKTIWTEVDNYEELADLAVEYMALSYMTDEEAIIQQIEISAEDELYVDAVKLRDLVYDRLALAEEQARIQYEEMPEEDRVYCG